MKATTKKQAWQMADEIFPTDYMKDERSSTNAGYDIYRSTVADRCYDYICDLGDRLEINLANGKTVNIWIEEEQTESITEAQMISYLQYKMDRFQKELAKYGMEDRLVNKMLDEMIACKEMVEAIIRKPVNLRQDGKVTIGF